MRCLIVKVHGMEMERDTRSVMRKMTYKEVLDGS